MLNRLMTIGMACLWLGSQPVLASRVPAFDPSDKAIHLQLRQDDGGTAVILCPDGKGQIHLEQPLAVGQLQVSGHIQALDGHPQLLLELQVDLQNDEGRQMLHDKLLLERFAQPLGGLRVMAPALPMSIAAARPAKKTVSKQASQPVASAPGQVVEKATDHQHGLIMVWAMLVDRPARCTSLAAPAAAVSKP